MREKSKGPNNRSLTVACLLTTILVCVSVFAFFSFGTNPVSNSNFEPGTQAETCRFLFWAYGSTFYCKDGDTGRISSSSDAAGLINQAITTTHDDGGGTVYLRGGPYNYSLTGSIVMQSYVTLQGDGWGEVDAPTTLVLANSVDDNVIEMGAGPNDHITIRNLRIEGNGANQASGHGINATNIDRLVVEWCGIFRTYGDGIHLSGGTIIAAHFNDLFIYGCGGYGMFIAGVDTFIEHCDVGNDYTDYATNPALFMYWAHKSWISDCGFWGADNGLKLQETNNTVISGCRFDYNTNSGIYIYNGSHNVISGCQIIGNSQETADTWDGITLTGGAAEASCFNTVTGCNIGGQPYEANMQKYAINEVDTYCNYNVFVGNTVEGETSETIHVSGNHTIVENNVGYNPIGEISDPVDGSNLVDYGGSGAFANNTQYTVVGATKMITFWGGTCEKIFIDGAQVLGATGVSILVRPGQTVKAIWSSGPTVKVFGM